jgi:hypothetical protein
METDVRRRVFEPQSGRERIVALREVLSTKQPAKVDGVFVEYHWARMILETYEELGPEGQAQLAATPVPRIPELIDAWAKGQPRSAAASHPREGGC